MYQGISAKLVYLSSHFINSYDSFPFNPWNVVN